MTKMLKEKIVDISVLNETTIKFTIESEYIAQNSKAGQFVNIRPSEGIDPILRRPISICDINTNENTFDIVFMKKGAGTNLLAEKKVGDFLDIVGPSGNGFYVSDEFANIAVVGGGIGIFPMLNLLKNYEHGRRLAYLGFRDEENVVLMDEFDEASEFLKISTDDGSFGYKGLVTDLLEKDLLETEIDIIYACGPMPMLNKVKEIANKHNKKCQISLEQRMGCGIGACLVCVCKTKKDDVIEYKRTCKEGPVFWANIVDFS